MAPLAETSGKISYDTAPKWQLVVESGPHGGAVVPIEGEEFRIGRDIANDFVAADSGIDSLAATIDPGRGVLTASQSGGLLVDDVRLHSGEHATIQPGTTLAIGQTRMRLVRVDHSVPAGAEPRAGRSRMPVVAPLAILAVMLAVLAVILFVMPGARQAAPAKPAVAMAQTGTAQLASQLQQRLVAQKLIPGVQLSVQPTAIIAHGTLGGAQQAVWNGTVRWFDGIAAGRVDLIDRVQILPGTIAAPVALGAVSTGPDPYIITQDGARFAINATLPGGWHLGRITPHAILIEKGGEKVWERF